MKHPILGGVGAVYYSLIWVLISSAHAVVLHYYFQISWVLSIQDSLIFNVIFACLGLGYWYIVRYSIPDTGADNRPLITLLATGATSIFIWIWIGSTMLQLIASSPTYLEFLETSTTWRVIAGAVYYVLMILGYYLIFYNRNLREQNHRQLKLATAVKEAELRMLKAQINPHFIFNSLNSISSLTISDPPKAQQMIIKLSGFMRYALGKDNHETNLLSQEIENIKLYLDIEKIRFGQRLNFENQVPESCYACKIPTLILQPLFENAIKHGVQESIETVNIRLSAENFPSSLVIKISNNFDPESSSEGTGIGLANIKQQLGLIYGSEDLLQYQKKEGIFEVSLEIPQ